jgi:hypothetical protein
VILVRTTVWIEAVTGVNFQGQSNDPFNRDSLLHKVPLVTPVGLDGTGTALDI